MNKILEGLSNLEILGLTLVGEARGEPIESQVGVGSVIRNRMHIYSTKYKALRDVCLEPVQFSCWNEDDVNYPMLIEIGNKFLNNQVSTEPYIKQCMWVASGIENWLIQDNTKSSVHYMTERLFDHARPGWARVIRSEPIQHGNHIFFNI